MSARAKTSGSGALPVVSAKDARRSTIKLTHFGRKSGKPYRVTVWFVVIDGRVWIGSLKRDRSWVKNVRAGGRAELDFGSGPQPATCRWVESAADTERFRQAIAVKHPVAARVLDLLVRGERCAFETDVRVSA